MAVPSQPDASRPAREAANNLLRPVVGDFVARTSISMASKRIGKSPETITMEDLPALSEALRPALRTLLGTPSADALVAELVRLGGEGGR